MITKYCVFDQELSIMNDPKPVKICETAEEAVQYAIALNNPEATVERRLFWTKEHIKLNSPMNFKKIWPKETTPAAKYAETIFKGGCKWIKSHLRADYP